MKKLVAVLLTGCLVMQPFSNSVLAAGGDIGSAETEFFSLQSDTQESAGSEPDKDADWETPGGGDTETGDTSQSTETATEHPQETAPDIFAQTETSEQESETVSGDENQSEETSGTETTTELTSETGMSEEELILGDPMQIGDAQDPEDEWESLPELPAISLMSADHWMEKSFLEVEVISTLPYTQSRNITVSISGGALASRSFILPDGGSESGVAKFEVAPGSYKVRIRADKFADYEQTVEVGARQTSRIEVATSRTESAGGTSGLRGWMRLGDVTGDYAITQEDIQEILNAMHRGANPAACNLTDASDDAVDLADLQIAVQNLNGSQQATVQTMSVPQGVISESALIDGEENLLNDEGHTTLQPVGEGAISDDNPVGMTFVFAQDAQQEPAASNQPPVLEGMSIQAPAEGDGEQTAQSNISAGTVQVAYQQENGSEGTFYLSIGGAVPKPAAQPVLQAAPIVAQPVAISAMAADAAADGPMAEEPGQPAQASEDLPQMIETAVMPAAAPEGSAVKVEPDGTLVLDFGGQIAVKRVTINITGTRKKEALVDIAKVEFVNDMESRIPAPQMNIPEFETIKGANEEIQLSWTAQSNVTAYELYVQGPVKKASEPQEQIVRVADTSHTVISIQDKPLKNFQDYTVKVRAVNGEWSSPWSEPQTARPEPESIPAAVDNVVVTGGYRSLRVSWKDMDDANGYMVYYGVKTKNHTVFYPVVENYAKPVDGSGCLTTNSYTITGLGDGMEYELYVVGWNEKGWGPDSLHAVAQTQSGETPALPQYRLINTSNGEGVLTAHIVNAVMGTHNGQKMVESPLDAERSGSKPQIGGQNLNYSQWAFGVADDNYASYWTKKDWDDGVSYPVNDFSKGITVTLDQDYKMNYLTFTAADVQGNPERARIVYWNTENGNTPMEVGASLIHKLDANNRPYYIVKFHQAVTANQIQLCIGTGYSRIELKVAEIHFHAYDPLDDEIMELFADEMHTTLAGDVTEERIRALEERLNTPDARGEYHPLYDSLLLELKAARELLGMQLDETIVIENSITPAKDRHLGFGGLNAWQPLGRTAAAGETLIVYVGHNVKNIGENTNLRLIFTQYHAEANCLMKTSGVLKVGRNEILVPAVSTNDFERGGQIYVAYDGGNASDKYGIRINGGVRIPVLNIYHKTGEQKKAALEKYVKDLEAYVGTIQAEHNENHLNKKNVDYEYDQQNCIANATDLMMDYMMYSVPATQVWEAISQAPDRAAQLETSLDAMEQTMRLFYHHKGLSNAPEAGSTNALPSQHLNIRYMRMFAGAFMYASGNHIGVGWNETKTAGSASGWDSLGWGFAHEIGHDINEPSYAVAEITNNYFAQLLTKAVSGTRFQYKDVYRKVTSGAIGRAANVGTQLALYWQLHLAYDDHPDDRHIYESYQEQFDNLFFARVDTYSRNPGKAPEEGLTLGGNSDQNLMRLACAAANKNILAFFERWGMVPDEETLAYANKFEKETKALYYVNDDARDYRAAHRESDANAVGAQVEASASGTDNQVSVTMSTDLQADAVLGYEITRSMFSDGERQSEVIGFCLAREDGSAVFTDTVSTIDNRVMQYEVRVVDKFLNYSAPADAGSVKISTGGAIGKDSWTVTTNMTSEDDVAAPRGHDDPDGGYDAQSGTAGIQYSIARIIDNERTENPYRGTSQGSAEIVIDMHRVNEVTSIRYQGCDLKRVTISVSRDGNNWVTVKENDAGCTGCGAQAKTIWFDSVHEANKDSWIGTYDARYVRLQIPQSGEITISEIDICGPSGDNLEFYDSGDGTPAVGVLQSDYAYNRKDPKDVIPKGSLVFAGTYKGNPAYNVVLLYDTQGNVIGAKDGVVKAEQIIFADVPEKGNLGETSEGTWVYYVKPGDWEEAQLGKIAGVRAELYRVDNAHTLEGERVVSDTGVIQIPQPLPAITLKATISEKQ